MVDCGKFVGIELLHHFGAENFDRTQLGGNWNSSGTRVSYRNSAEIRLKWSHRVLASLVRFLLPDMFIHDSQVLFHRLAGCIDTLASAHAL